ncbi:MAG: hypothetical protein KAS96_09090 [Planctomycetes bacterium]|nr:hypothetical protein [Planctomycetota bacterium]
MKYLNKLVFITIVTVALSSTLTAKPLPKTAKLIPADTVALLEVENFSELQSQFEKTSLYKIYKEPAMKAFFDEIKNKFKKGIEGEDNIFVKSIADSELLPRGRVSFALVMDATAVENNEPTALFILQWGENLEKIKELINESLTKADEQGWRIKTDEYRSVKIRTISSEGSKRLSFGFAGNLSYCFIDDVLLGSEDIEVLKFMIAHIKGATSETLFDNDSYNNAIKSVGPNHDVDFFINIKKIIQVLSGNDTSGQFKTIVDNLGIDNLSNIVAAASVARKPGCSFSAKMNVKIQGEKKGIFKMLDLKSAPVKAPAFLPASVYSMIVVNVDLPNAYSELYKIIASFSPGFAAMLNTPLVPPSQPDQPSLQLKTSIIDYLGSQVIYAQQMNKPFKKGKSPTNATVAIETTDHINLEKSLKEIHGKLLAVNEPDSTKELLGHTIYILKMKNLPMFATRSPGDDPEEPGGEVDMPNFAFTVLDTHLIIGSEESVENAVRNLNSKEAASLNSTKWFNDAKSNINPSSVGAAIIEDSCAAAEVIWWTIKQFAEIAKQGNDSDDNFQGAGFSILGPIKPELLPEFETVSKYFGVSVFQGLSTAEGFNFQYKYLDAQNIK